MKKSSTTAKTNTKTNNQRKPKALTLAHGFGSQLRLKDAVAKAKDGDQFMVNRADEENYGAMFEKWLRYLANEYGFTVKTQEKYQKYLITVVKG